MAVAVRPKIMLTAVCVVSDEAELVKAGDVIARLKLGSE